MESASLQISEKHISNTFNSQSGHFDKQDTKGLGKTAEEHVKQITKNKYHTAIDVGSGTGGILEGLLDNQLDLKVRKGKVEDLKFKIIENKRFYTKAIEGKPFIAAPSLMSRICGTCSISHLLCCITAIENALSFKPSEQVMTLRKLTKYGLMIRDHALHLYFFQLPDVFEKDSILAFDPNNPKEHDLVHDAFAVKSAGNNLSKTIAGKAVQP